MSADRQKVEALAQKIGMQLDGEEAATCMTVLCFLLAIGIAHLDPSMDEMSIATMTKQVTNALNLLRAQDEAHQEDTQIH